MAIRGRPPKPTNLRLLEGNPGHRPVNTMEPKPPAKAPTPPKFLNDEAKRMFRKLAKQLVAIGTVTQIDGWILADYCDAAVEVERLTEELKVEGTTIVTPNGYIQAHPYVAMRNQCLARMARAGSELGIGAASRTRVKTNASGKKTPFGEYLSHGKKQQSTG